MLALAMQLHDQYVDKGKAQNAQLIAEGQTIRKNLIDEGQRKHDEVIAQADEYSKKTHDSADQYSQQVHEDADSYASRVRQQADQEVSQKKQDAQKYVAGIRSDAQAYDSKTRTDADNYAKSVKAKLMKDTTVIEGNITSLKKFENEYRTRLTDFLNQLIKQVSATNNYSDQATSGALQSVSDHSAEGADTDNGGDSDHADNK